MGCGASAANEPINMVFDEEAELTPE